MSYHDITRFWCEGPASIHRLPRKGRLEVGFDGDLVLIDPNAEQTVHCDNEHESGNWSAWEGKSLMGKPIVTVVGGHVVVRNDEFLIAPEGKALSHAM